MSATRDQRAKTSEDHNAQPVTNTSEMLAAVGAMAAKMIIAGKNTLNTNMLSGPPEMPDKDTPQAAATTSRPMARLKASLLIIVGSFPLHNALVHAHWIKSLRRSRL